MGRKTLAGFSLLAVLSAFMILSGCRRETPSPPDPASRFSPSREGKSRELGIFSGDLRVGDLRVSLREGTWDGKVPATELSQSTFLRLSYQGQTFTLKADQRAWAGPDLRFLASKGWMDFGAGRWETTALEAGRGRLQVVQKTAVGNPIMETFPLAEGVPVSDILPLFLNGQPPGDGTRREMRIFNTSLGQEIPFAWTDHGQTGFGRLFSVSFWGMAERIWLDADGLVAREELFLGVLAREAGEGEPAGDLPLESVLSMVSVPAIGIPGELKDLKEVTFALEGSFPLPPETRWQEVSKDGDRAMVRISRPEAGNSGRGGPEQDDFPIGDFGLDLDSPRVLELSRRITEGVEGPWEKGLAIGRWVNRNLKKSMRESFSALQVLGAGEGECQSHSLLTVSLCRASGVPARFAYGVVYMPQREAFLFHTWVEVFSGEWIPMDPTLGDFPSGVDHLTLATGGYRDQFRVFPFITGTGGWRMTFVPP